MCDRIIELEPGYGRAWALKALAQAYLFYGYNKGGENGVVAARRALELDPSLPEPYCVEARAAAADRNFADAEIQVKRALEVAPDMKPAFTIFGNTRIARASLAYLRALSECA